VRDGVQRGQVAGGDVGVVHQLDQLRLDHTDRWVIRSASMVASVSAASKTVLQHHEPLLLRSQKAAHR